MEQVDRMTCDTVSQVSTGIGRDEAIAVAMKHAGVDKSRFVLMECEPDCEHGRKIYDVRFCLNDIEYEYEIDAETGSVGNQILWVLP